MAQIDLQYMLIHMKIGRCGFFLLSTGWQCEVSVAQIDSQFMLVHMRFDWCEVGVGQIDPQFMLIHMRFGPFGIFAV